MHTLQPKLSSRRSKALLCSERARPACFILQSCEDPRGAPQYVFWSCTKIKFQMVVCLVSQLLKNLASEIHKAQAQVIGQCSMSSPDVKCSFGRSVPSILDSLPCFSRLLWKPAPESQSQNTFRNPHCRMIFGYSDWKTKTEAQQRFFFLESTTREDSEHSHRPSGPALMRNLSCFSNLCCAAATCKGP